MTSSEELKTTRIAATAHGHYAPSSAEMAEYDRETIAAGMPAIELMERAAAAIYDELRRDALLELARPTVVVCGPGNNGGDGLALGCLLIEDGFPVRLVCARAERYSAEHLAQAEAFATAGGEILQLKGDSDPLPPYPVTSIARHDFVRLLDGAALLVDALLGIGQRQKPRDAIAEIVGLCAEFTGTVVAIDVPTGVDATSGAVFQPAIRANLTLTIELIKRGMQQYPARQMCGEIRALPIGINASQAAEFCILAEAGLPPLPVRGPAVHKGDLGHVLVVGGSAAMPGAPVLSALAALRSGAGLVTKVQLLDCVAPGELAPELMLRPVPAAFLANGSAVLGPASLSAELRRAVDRATVVVMGPGLGLAPETEAFTLELLKLLREKGKTTVIDADALTIIARSKTRALPPAVLTPHPGEAARLLDLTSDTIQRDRFHAVRAIAAYFDAVALLKGAGTVVYGPRRGAIAVSGNRWMATAGSGDVLSGVIAALIAQGLEREDSARLGVHLHGLAADLTIAEREAPLIASDIIAKIPEAIAAIGSGKSAQIISSPRADSFEPK